ncbi:hypothetical protein S10a_00030 [Klebsiella phage VLCpiS10a]|nr:hypothetical protein S10a_00030 [Klebsiella phage VLCpiS10a]WLJ70246.1 hypothetical protein BU9_CDS0012 [Klebsiella phage Kpn BU9]
MLNPNESWTSLFVILAIICGVVGWGVIEFLLWLFSFVHVSFGR